MKKHIFFTGLLIAGILLSSRSQAQKPETNHKKTKEIVIRKNGDKDIKTTIEINGDKITVNGKPLSDYHGDDVSIIQRDIVKDRSHRFLISPENGEDMEINAFGNDWDNDLDAESRPFLGVLTEKEKEGVKITEVVKGSAAEKAGLQKDDIITSLNDKKISSPEDLMDAVKSHKPGDNVKIDYLRDNQKKDVKIKLGEKKERNRTFLYNDNNNNMNGGFNFKMPKMPKIPNNYFKYNYWNKSTPKLGLKIEDVENNGGAKVLNVEEGSAAEKAGLKKDDIITEINGEKVNNVDEIRDQVNEADDKDSIRVKTKRNGTDMTFEIKIPKQVNSADL